MSPAEKRLANLKELLKAEKGNTSYAQDLRLSIKQLKETIKNTSEKGYKMVEV